jgi:hypothetical protein
MIVHAVPLSVTRHRLNPHGSASLDPSYRHLTPDSSLLTRNGRMGEAQRAHAGISHQTAGQARRSAPLAIPDKEVWKVPSGTPTITLPQLFPCPLLVAMNASAPGPIVDGSFVDILPVQEAVYVCVWSDCKTDMLPQCFQDDPFPPRFWLLNVLRYCDTVERGLD